jgi:hypothetical protein
MFDLELTLWSMALISLARSSTLDLTSFVTLLSISAL